MQTKSNVARIAGALAIAVILPLAILITMVHGKKTVAHGTAAGMSAAAVAPVDMQKVAAQYGKLPMSFEPNQGQSAPQVKFVSRGQGYQLFLTGNEAVMAVRSATKRKNVSPKLARRFEARETSQFAVVSMKLDGANENAAVTGGSQLPGKVNYFIGKDASKWHTDIPTYAQVKYAGIYPGIDLVYYGNQKELEYDFVVAPGADPKAIAFNVNGASALRVSKQGDLVMKTAAGDVTFAKPVVYQEIAGERRHVAGKFLLKGEHEVKFALGAYDATQTLTIDPSVLIYSTYLGGSGVNGDFGYGIALDATGDAFVVGTTSSADFNPVPGGYTPPANIGAGVTAAFVTELNAAGTAFTYSTYLGGSGTAGFGDGGDAIAVDPTGHVFISGYTESTDFPTTPNAYNQNNNPPESVSQLGAGFVAEFNPAISGTGQLLYSTYIGGSGTIDEAHSVATDGTGKVYATGVSDSADFPPVNPLQPTPAGVGNAYVAEFDTTKSGTPSLIFSTVLGGTGAGDTNVPYSSVGLGITVDTAGHSYVSGATTSTDFAPAPATGTACGTGGQGTAFLVEINTSLATPTSMFALCLGGTTGDTVATSVAIAPDATAGITGQTFATDFAVTNTIPLPPGVPSSANNVSVVLAAKIKTTGGTAVAYSTVFGGKDGDNGYGIAFDATGNMYIGGETQSGDFPVTQGALQTANDTLNGAGFITKLNPAGGGASDIVYSTYFAGAGGTGSNTSPDAVNGIAVLSSNAYVVGQTASANSGPHPFPITDGAPQNVLPATSISNAFIAEAPLVPTVGVSPVTLDFGTVMIGTTSPAMYVTVTNNTTVAVTLTTPPVISGANAADFANSPTAGPGGPVCGASIASGTACTLGVTFTPTVNGTEAASLAVVTSQYTVAVALTGTGSTTAAAFTANPTSLTFTGTLIGDTSASQTVTFTNSTGASVTPGQAAVSAASFVIGSDTCSNTAVANGATCTIAITLAPPTGTSAGAVTGNLALPNGTATTTVALTGTVWDFSLTVPATATVPKNGSNSFSALINGAGGFTGTVNVSCSSANAQVANCSVSPTSGTPTQSVTVTVTNGSGSAMVPVMPVSTPNIPTKQIVFAGMALMLLFLVPMTRQRRTQLGLIAAMLVFTVVAGCSGSVHPKSTTLTITGSSGDISRSYTVTVNRQ